MSESGDVTQLKKIWKVCFGDSEKVIDSFFSEAYNENTTLVLLHNETVAAMLSMLPIELHSAASKTSGYYVYAVATLPEFQGRGYMSLLEKESCRIAKANKKQFCLLVPATQPLFRMYGRLGYQTFSSVSTIKLYPAQNSSVITIENCDFDKFYNLRTQFLCEFSQSVRFVKHYEKYAYNEYIRAGGLILFANGGYICAYKKDNLLTITESSHKKNQVENIYLSLIKHTGCKHIIMRIPGNDGFSMIKRLDSTSSSAKIITDTNNNYFGFALE